MTFRIVAEPRRWLVKIIVDSSEYVSAASSKGRATSPHHLHGGLVESQLLVIIRYTTEEERIEPHLRSGYNSVTHIECVYMKVHNS